MTNTKLNEGRIASIFTSAAIVIALVLVILAAWYFFTSGKTPGTGDSNIGIELGQTAPDFALTDIDGNTFSLSDHQDHVVIMDFMATWCPPCVEEMGHLRQIYSNYSASGVVIMSIDVDPSETDETIHQFKTNYGDDWIFASGPSVGTTYGVIYIPTMYIIDQQGRIAYKNVGVTSASTLAAEIDKLL
jgi:peroxiredoxin